MAKYLKTETKISVVDSFLYPESFTKSKYFLQFLVNFHRSKVVINIFTFTKRNQNKRTIPEPKKPTNDNIFALMPNTESLRQFPKNPISNKPKKKFTMNIAIALNNCKTNPFPLNL